MPTPWAKSREIGLDEPNIIHLVYDKIVYITSISEHKNHVDISANGAVYHKRISLSKLEKELPKSFLRIEKSYILNMKYWKGTHNSKVAFLHPNESPKSELPIGKEYINALERYLKNRY